MVAAARYDRIFTARKRGGGDGGKNTDQGGADGTSSRSRSACERVGANDPSREGCSLPGSERRLLLCLPAGGGGTRAPQLRRALPDRHRRRGGDQGNTRAVTCCRPDGRVARNGGGGGRGVRRELPPAEAA